MTGPLRSSAVRHSDHVHDDRYYTKAETDVIVGAAGATVVHGPGFGIPNPLLVQSTMTNIAETITSPTAGRWSITKFVSGYAVCTSGTAHFLFLALDGVPVRGIAVYNPSASHYIGVLSGATLGVIPAGAHTVNIGAHCFAGTASFTISQLFTMLSVVILP